MKTYIYKLQKNTKHIRKNHITNVKLEAYCTIQTLNQKHINLPQKRVLK